SRRQQEQAIPAGFDNMMKALSEKFERLQFNDNNRAVTGPLDDRIAELLSKLEVSESRLAHLETIEKGMAVLLAQLEQLRAERGASATAPSAAWSETVEALKQVVAELKDTQRATEREHQDSLEAVHGTIEGVVGRLATIESNLRQPAPVSERP